MLRAHQAAWKSLSWTEEETIPIVQGYSWELFGGVLAQAEDPTSISFVRLPSKLRGLKKEEWSLQDLDEFQDFAMDPAHDLLVTYNDNN